MSSAVTHRRHCAGGKAAISLPVFLDFLKIDFRVAIGGICKNKSANIIRRLIFYIIYIEISNAFTLCVNAPTDIMSTPLSAAALSVSSVIPPDASSTALPAVIFTASFIMDSGVAPVSASR